MVTPRADRPKEGGERPLEELMHAYVDGDSRAFEALFEALAPRVHAFFVRSFGAGATADDLLQTTFLKIHAGRATYRAGRAVRPWVFGIAARVRADELRRRYRVPPHESDEGLAERVFHHPPDPAAAREITVRVRDALSRLPEGQRVVVLLHRFEGLAFREIGEALGLEEGTVRVRAFRAYRTLRETLADLGPEEPST